jgi:iron(II)-dependent oxidoreductase
MASAMHPPISGTSLDLVAARLADVRERTLELVGALDWPTLRRQHIPILSPMVWDLGHIGSFEEIWLAQTLAGLPPLEDGFHTMFDPVVNPRPVREALPLPTGDRLLEYLRRVREQTLEVLGNGSLPDSELTRDGFVYEMVAEHEEQHQETLLQCMQVLEAAPYRPRRRRALPTPGPVVAADEEIEIPGGEVSLGRSGRGFAYDNERPRHRQVVPSFAIERFPVTNGRYAEFVAGGGYATRSLWSDDGWRWLRSEDPAVEAPRNWARPGGNWLVRYMDQTLPVTDAADRPVQNVCYWEAEAFARWAGKRLPTEPEWETAALWDPEAERARAYPWGDEPPDDSLANLDQLAFAPAPIGSYPRGASAHGAEQMLGDVWEWTSSDFTAYPGFRAFPYDEYSAIFFGPEYKVLRGGSWATRPAVARGTFRNWDHPIRRQIFAGIRLARGR